MGTFEADICRPIVTYLHGCIAHCSPAAVGECACSVHAADECNRVMRPFAKILWPLVMLSSASSQAFVPPVFPDPLGNFRGTSPDVIGAFSQLCGRYLYFLSVRCRHSTAAAYRYSREEMRGTEAASTGNCVSRGSRAAVRQTPCGWLTRYGPCTVIVERRVIV